MYFYALSSRFWLSWQPLTDTGARSELANLGFTVIHEGEVSTFTNSFDEHQEAHIIAQHQQRESLKIGFFRQEDETYEIKADPWELKYQLGKIGLSPETEQPLQGDDAAVLEVLKQQLQMAYDLQLVRNNPQFQGYQFQETFLENGGIQIQISVPQAAQVGVIAPIGV